MRTVVEPEAGPLGPKKTILVMATVIGCIAILWPKVFHPMLIGNSSPASVDHTLPQILKDRGPGCCGVVLNSDRQYMNSTLAGDLKRFRESIHTIGRDQSIRQERPLHMRPEPVHPAMRERGAPTGPTRTVVEGRPIPGMRPPMGGGSFQQSPPKGPNSMGLIMPLYTFGIVAFFAYTILKIVFKKNPTTAQEPYVEIIDPNLAKKSEQSIIQKSSSKDNVKRNDKGPSPKLGWKDHEATNGTTESKEILDSANQVKSSSNLATNLNDDVITLENKPVEDREGEDLLDIAALKQKIAETEIAMTKIIARMSQIVPKTQEPNDPTPEKNKAIQTAAEDQQTVQILGMEVTSSCEGGKKWDPANRIGPVAKPHPDELIETVEAQEIYLEGTLPNESQILVSDAEERVEEGSNDEGAAIILSSKMTLSLISLDPAGKENKRSGSGGPVEENSLKNHDRPANGSSTKGRV